MDIVTILPIVIAVEFLVTLFTKDIRPALILGAVAILMFGAYTVTQINSTIAEIAYAVLAVVIIVKFIYFLGDVS